MEQKKLFKTSTPQTNTLNTGDTWNVDLDDDGIADLIVEVFDIDEMYNSAEIKLTTIDHENNDEEIIIVPKEDGSDELVVINDSTVVDENKVIDTPTTTDETSTPQTKSSMNWMWWVSGLLILAIITFILFPKKKKDKFSF